MWNSLHLSWQTIRRVPTSVTCVNDFTSVSGIKRNLDKFVLFPLKTSQLSDYFGIPIKGKVTYIGIIIFKYVKQQNNIHFDPIIEKKRKKNRQKRKHRGIRRDVQTFDW